MVALTKTTLINNGLRLISANLINDPGEQSESARQCNGCYEQVVRSELELNAWYFAKAQAALPARAEIPLFKFANAFELPSDFIRLVELEHRWVFSIARGVDVNPVPLWEVQGRAIFTDLPAPLRITYLKDVSDDPSMWASSFADVVAAAIAKEVAMALTKSEAAVTRAERAYKTSINNAIRTNAIQMPPMNIPDGSWLTVREY